MSGLIFGSDHITMINKKFAFASYSMAIILAFITFHYNVQPLITFSEHVACWFVKILKWISLPMIFLSVTSAIASQKPNQSSSGLFTRLLKYTVFTTMLSAATALILYVTIQPAISTGIDGNCPNNKMAISTSTYSISLIATLIMCVLVSLTIKYFEKRSPLAKTKLAIISSYKIAMFLIQKLFMLLPIAIWAFVIEFFMDLDKIEISQFSKYLTIIVSANLIQACITLPIILYFHKINALKLAKELMPALSTAFWSKSSGVALPEAIRCAIDRAKMSPEVAKFSLPLCITLNMNACAAFILTTVLFVSESSGISFSPLVLCSWIVIATIAALGNAGIPMGCYTLSGVLISYIGAPLTILGLILPFYSMIDMLESAINVWSDGCVTAILNKKHIEAEKAK